MADPWTLLIAGDLIGAVLASYTNIIGYYFYGLIIFIGMVILYMKTQNYGVVGVTGLLVAGSILAYMPPEVHNLGILFLIFSLAIVIYRVFFR